MYLHTYPAAADVKLFKLLRTGVNNGHELLLHSYRSTASADIACYLCDVLDVEKLDRLLANALRRLFQVKFLGNRQQKAVIASRFSLRNYGLERLIKRLTEFLGNVYPVNKLVALISLNLVGYLFCIQKTHCVSFKFLSHTITLLIFFAELFAVHTAAVVLTIEVILL